MESSIFREYDIRGKYPQEIDETAAEAIAEAFARVYKINKIALGRDKRSESEVIYKPIIRGLARAGCQIYDMKEESTPGLQFAVGDAGMDGGIMVTASHNPTGYTGMKMVDKNGLAVGMRSGLAKVQVMAVKILKQTGKKPVRTAKIKELEIFSRYYKSAFSLIDHRKIENLKIVLDASGGSAAKLVDYAFVRIPGRVTKMNFRKDRFRDHGLNPMLPANRRSIEKEVVREEADLGIIWDGDGDRMLFIDERGKFVEPYYINCLLVQLVLTKIKELKLKNRKIVVDSRMRLAVSRIIRENGGEAIVCRSGYANLVKKMKEERVLFGCENSGHYLLNFRLFGGRNFVYGDGIIPALMIIEYLSASGLKISQAVAPFKKAYKISGEINLENRKFEKFSGQVKKKFAKAKFDVFDGMGVSGDGWFFSVRQSKTEPLVRVNIEADNAKTLSEIKSKLL